MYHQSHLIKIFSNHKEWWAVKLLVQWLERGIRESGGSRVKAIKINLRRGGRIRRGGAPRMVNISCLNFRRQRSESKFFPPATTSRLAKSSTRAEIITLKLAIFLFMIKYEFEMPSHDWWEEFRRLVALAWSELESGERESSPQPASDYRSRAREAFRFFSAEDERNLIISGDLFREARRLITKRKGTTCSRESWRIFPFIATLAVNDDSTRALVAGNTAIGWKSRGCERRFYALNVIGVSYEEMEFLSRSPRRQIGS